MDKLKLGGGLTVLIFAIVIATYWSTCHWFPKPRRWYIDQFNQSDRRPTFLGQNGMDAAWDYEAGCVVAFSNGKSYWFPLTYDPDSWVSFRQRDRVISVKAASSKTYEVAEPAPGVNLVKYTFRTMHVVVEAEFKAAGKKHTLYVAPLGEQVVVKWDDRIVRCRDSEAEVAKVLAKSAMKFAANEEEENQAVTVIEEESDVAVAESNEGEPPHQLPEPPAQAADEPPRNVPEPLADGAGPLPEKEAEQNGHQEVQSPSQQPEPAESVDKQTDSLAETTGVDPLQANSQEPGEPDSPQDSKPLRTWTDSTGTHQIEAEFVSYGMGTVKLRGKDGTEIALPMERLSEQDQDWIRQRGRK